MSENCRASYTLPHGDTAEYGCHTFGCFRKEGHTGPHWDHYGNWLINGRRQPVPEAPKDWQERMERA